MEENLPTPEPEAIGQLTDDVAELKAKSVSGFGWSTIQQIVGRVTTFVVNLALARLLMPDDFGTLAVLGIFLAISGQLADIGFGSSLVRSERVEDADLSTVFYYNMGMSSLLYLILFVAAPWIADYFRNPVLVSVLRVLSLSMVINSLCSIQAILVWRQMQFRKDMLIQLASGVLGGLTGIVMAYFSYGYWALVGMGLANSIVRLVGYWCSSPWRPQLIFSVERLKLHFGYGSRMVGAGLITTLYNNLMTIIIGRSFSMSILGLYGNANSLYIVPVSIIADPINKVTFPVFVRFQNEKERLRAGYRRVMRLLFQLSCPLMTGLVVLANPVYHFLYGDKWMAAAPYFQILCICGILYPINSYNINILEVKGRSDLHLRLEIIRRIIGVAAAFIGLQFGIYGLLWSTAITQVIFLFINSYYSGRFIDYPLGQQLAELFPFVLMSAVSGGVLWSLDIYALSSLADFWRLSIGSAVLGLTYLLLVYLFAREDFLYVWGLVRHYVLRRPATQS
ncbi:MAG: lipopolysaccharide biosynthesis protein [Porphyromonadaceae bacterium]|nr:lipopolysaccharide biosynthesis protein [Porphyromonadaceae bacterium]